MNPHWYEILLKDLIAFGGGFALILAVLLIALSVRDAKRLHDWGFMHYAEVLTGLILTIEPIIRLVLRIPFVASSITSWEYVLGLLLIVKGLYGILRRHGPRFGRKGPLPR